MFNQKYIEKWDTKDELDFIIALGSHINRNRQKLRLSILQNYKEGCYKRNNWGDIHRKTILDFTNSLIKDEVAYNLSH